MRKLMPVDDVEHIRHNIKTFKSQALSHEDQFYQMVNKPQQKYWVYDLKLDAFGAVKFVGFKGMTFELYYWALHSKDLNESFYTSDAKRPIERITERQFKPDNRLSSKLIQWTYSICPKSRSILENPEWEFISLG